MSIRISCAAITKRIFAGKVSKDGLYFLAGKVDVTSDVLKAIIDKIGVGNTEIVSHDGKPVFEIEVRAVDSDI